MRWEVTFTFEINGKSYEISTTVYADNAIEAIKKGRDRYHPAVLDDVHAVAVEISAGGKRKGAGAKAGSKRVASPRTVKKQIKWTAEEWAKIEQGARDAGQNVTDYQRSKLLKGET